MTARSEAVLRRNRREIDDFADGYPFAAAAYDFEIGGDFRATSVSRITGQGVRTWRFKTEEERDAFVAAIPSAEPVGEK